MSDVKPETKTWQGERSRKILRCSAEVQKYQKEYVLSLKERIKEEPYIFGEGPGILYRSMGLHQIVQVYYGSLISAKQMSEYYFNRLNEEGYFRQLCRYCTAALGYLFDKKPEIAPWGGLPKPAAVVCGHMCDAITRVLELCARQFDVPIFFMDSGHLPSKPPSAKWWEDSETEPHHLARAVENLRELIQFLERTTGRRYRESKLAEALYRGVEASYYWQKGLDLACTTVPAPITIADVFSSVPMALWHKGTPQELECAKMFYNEIRDRVEKGMAACPNEKIRLMWRPDQPVWFSLGLYHNWEDKYGAIFIPSNYLEFQERPMFGGRNYGAINGDSLETLVRSGTNGLFIEKTFPTSAIDYWLYQAKRYKVDGVIWCQFESCRTLAGPSPFVCEALEKAGIPTLRFSADMLDVREWDDAHVKSMITSFVEMLLARKHGL